MMGDDSIGMSGSVADPDEMHRDELDETQEELEAATVRAVQAENDHERDCDALRSVVVVLALDIAKLLAAVPRCIRNCDRPATRRLPYAGMPACDEHALEGYEDYPHAAVVRRHGGQ